MLVICEGVDNVGKTFFANQLRGRIEWTGEVEMLHFGPIQDHPLAEYELPLQHYVPGSGRHIICDRHALGEHVYGPLYRGKSTLDPASQWHLEAFLNSRGAVLVHLVADLGTLRRRHAAENEDFLEARHIGRVAQEYDRVVSESRVQHKIRGQTSHDELLDLVVAVAEGAEKTAQACRLVPEYIGPDYPGLLLLGEKRGPTAPEFTTTFAPMPGTSGKYLLDTLLEVDSAYWNLMGMANAVEAADRLSELWDVLKRPPVVALGNAAYEIARTALPDAGVGAIPHPQYWRRFMHNHGTFYAKLLRKAWQRGTDLRKARP